MSRITAAKRAHSTERGTPITKGTASNNKRTDRKTIFVRRKSIAIGIARTIVGAQTIRKSRASISATSGKNEFIVEYQI